MKTSARAAVEVIFQRKRQCLTAGQVLINRLCTNYGPGQLVQTPSYVNHQHRYFQHCEADPIPLATRCI
jgi:hypothetical protein